MPIPLKVALLDKATGKATDERLILFDKARDEVPLEGAPEKPVLSINRDFSAPIILETDRSAADLTFLSAHDDDPFARYEAMQQLMLDTLIAAIERGEADHAPVIEAVKQTLTDPHLDPAFIAEAVLLPSESLIGDRMAKVDPEAIRARREALRADLGQALESLWRDAYATHTANRYEYNPAAKGARRLKTIALGYIDASGAADAPVIAKRQFDDADNMTDRQGALGVLVNGYSTEREAALAAFYERYRGNALVIDKWFTTQALSTRDDVLDQVEALAKHPDFTLENPNRLRSLVAAFAVNQRAFNDASGRGYRFLADMILAEDRLNPQTAARLVAPLGRWRRFDEGRAGLMKAELEGILATPGLSKDVFEQASKSLG